MTIPSPAKNSETLFHYLLEEEKPDMLVIDINDYYKSRMADTMEEYILNHPHTRPEVLIICPIHNTNQIDIWTGATFYYFKNFPATRKFENATWTQTYFYEDNNRHQETLSAQFLDKHYGYRLQWQKDLHRAQAQERAKKEAAQRATIEKQKADEKILVQNFIRHYKQNCWFGTGQTWRFFGQCLPRSAFGRDVFHRPDTLSWDRIQQYVSKQIAADNLGAASIRALRAMNTLNADHASTVKNAENRMITSFQGFLGKK